MTSLGLQHLGALHNSQYLPQFPERRGEEDDSTGAVQYNPVTTNTAVLQSGIMQLKKSAVNKKVMLNLACKGQCLSQFIKELLGVN